MRIFLVLIFLSCTFHTIAQNVIVNNPWRLSAGVQFSNAKYPRGVSVGYSSGATEIQEMNLGWFLQASREIKIRNRWSMETGLSLAKYSYVNRYNYPSDYIEPRIIDTRSKYLFVSFDYRVLFKLIDKEKIQIFPYAGIAMNINLKSETRIHSDIYGKSISSFLNTTNDEEKVNFSYEVGSKLMTPLNDKHSIVLTFGYNHFLNEQYGPGPGKLLYSLRLGLGYTF